mmetsp:Transcript_56795/g.122793  ORF Transcript_56795/g.122793 Transcript_56795/m.122793 type:complete len:103 (+) Transcript_56795:680-988(+)
MWEEPCGSMQVASKKQQTRQTASVTPTKPRSERNEGHLGLVLSIVGDKLNLHPDAAGLSAGGAAPGTLLTPQRRCGALRLEAPRLRGQGETKQGHQAAPLGP